MAMRMMSPVVAVRLRGVTLIVQLGPLRALVFFLAPRCGLGVQIILRGTFGQRFDQALDGVSQVVCIVHAAFSVDPCVRPLCICSSAGSGLTHVLFAVFGA